MRGNYGYPSQEEELEIPISLYSHSEKWFVKYRTD